MKREDSVNLALNSVEDANLIVLILVCHAKTPIQFLLALNVFLNQENMKMPLVILKIAIPVARNAVELVSRSVQSVRVNYY